MFDALADRARHVIAWIAAASIGATCMPSHADSTAAADVFQSAQATFRVVTIARGLDTPWGLAFLPDGDLLVSSKLGKLQRVRKSDGALIDVAGLPTDMYVGRQSGLHDLALHPQFAQNAFLYLTYSAGTEQANRPVLMRYRLVDDRLVDAQVIYQPDVMRTGPSHSGGRILFHSDGSIFLPVGPVLDFVDAHQAQDLSHTYGSVVRLRDDGSASNDNPFVGRADARSEIYSYGHRNVQGLAQRPRSRQVWSVEHGPKGGDELNLLIPGANYGWPLTTYGVDYDGSIVSDLRSTSGVESPIWYWRPSIAPASIAFYDGHDFPEWRGDLFVAALAGMQLQRLELEGDRVIGIEPLLSELGARFRRVQMGPDGFLYVMTDHRDGRVLRLEAAQ